MKPATSPSTSRTTPVERVPALQNGDRLTRDEFERRYEAMPHLKKAELIEGVVYLPSPQVSVEDLASPSANLISFLGVYSALTPGVSGPRLGPASRGGEATLAGGDRCSRRCPPRCWGC